MKARLARIATSIVTRNIVTFLVILLLVVTPLIYRYLDDVEDLMSDTFKAQLDAVGELGRFMLPAEDVAAVRNIIWYDTPEYDGILRILATIQRNFGVDNAVLLRRMPDGGFVYFADGNAQFEINQEAHIHRLFPATLPPARAAWETGRSSKTTLFESGDSRWFQVYVPLRHEDEVVALLLLNKFATPIAVAIDQRQREVMLGMGLALAGGIFVWWFLTSRSLRPLIRLQQASRQIAAGDLGVEIPAFRSRSEIGQLNDSFRSMVDDLRANRAEIEEYNRTLEERIAQRTWELQGLFDNMDEGLLTIDAQGAIDPRYSKAAGTMLGEIGADANLIDRLSDDEEARKTVRDTFGLLLGGAMMLDWDDMVANLPTEFQPAEGRWLRARYRPVYDRAGENIERVMVILQDITLERELVADADRNRERQAMVVQIIQNRETFDLFYADAVKLLQASEEACAAMELIRRRTVDETFRTLHTVKGTAGVFGLREVADRAHAVEDVLRELGRRRDESWTDEERAALTAAIADVRERLVAARSGFLALVGEDEQEPSFTVAESKIDRITAAVLAELPASYRERIGLLLERLKRIPTGRLLRKYRSVVESTAARLGKQAQLVVHDAEDAEITAPFFQQIDPTLLHIIRNALDHGLEDGGARMEAGKEPLGIITCDARRRDGGIVITLSDDGKGIDLARVKALGVERGFVPDGKTDGFSREDTLRLLFLPGFSSKDEVSDLSGRGVGLDVVRTDVERMHGRMRMVTRPGRGTTFQLYYPLPG